VPKSEVPSVSKAPSLRVLATPSDVCPILPSTGINRLLICTHHALGIRSRLFDNRSRRVDFLTSLVDVARPKHCGQPECQPSSAWRSRQLTSLWQFDDRLCSTCYSVDRRRDVLLRNVLQLRPSGGQRASSFRCKRGAVDSESGGDTWAKDRSPTRLLVGQSTVWLPSPRRAERRRLGFPSASPLRPDLVGQLCWISIPNSSSIERGHGVLLS
jgi:hypothetical protein